MTKNQINTQKQVVKLTVLGCGSSSGTPVIGCSCATCKSTSRKNKRSRSSALIQIGSLNFVIDTGPDFRAQMLRTKIEHIDAILYTHPHADHLNGIDDLRAFCFKQKDMIPVYGNEFTINNVTNRFDYAFLPANNHWDKPVLQAHTIGDEPFVVHGVDIIPIKVTHGRWTCTDYRIGNIAWLTDLNAISDEECAKLKGLDYLFLDCLRHDPYPSHLGWNASLALAKKIGAKQTYLIHMTHEMEYAATVTQCPEGVSIAYDGLKVRSWIKT
ncbi:MBL fold metallo-hydrolase [Neisseria sp. Ec49-e6-T10]|uniref:MBL fold metallo-hydrolase n=1 Tax=Neisseria sp. Ec49-e6-T10 TaxID=3140744 RepID=UPI003EB875E3